MAKPKPTPARETRRPPRSPARTYYQEEEENESNVVVAAVDANTPHKIPSKRARVYTDIYFYIPNLIGYTRVALTLGGLHLVLKAHREFDLKSNKHEDWMTGLAMYTASFVLDFFDGYAARAFSQSSNYGAVLDMVTDRVSTMLLLLLLSLFYSQTYLEHFALLAALDYSSHWVQMYAAKGHHKTSNQDKNIFVRAFYGFYPFFGFCCAGTEIFYIAMAAKRFLGDTNELLNLALPILFTACVCKNVVNLAQLCSGFEAVAKADCSKD